MAYKDPFNFFPNDDFKKSPNYRVEYYRVNGTEVSCPAIFKNDKDAIRTAIECHSILGYEEIGLNCIRVLKYEKKGLREIFRLAS